MSNSCIEVVELNKWWKFFLTACYVSKIDFSLKFLGNRPFSYTLNLSQPTYWTILCTFFHILTKIVRAARCRLKVMVLFTIPYSNKFFVMRFQFRNNENRLIFIGQKIPKIRMLKYRRIKISNFVHGHP